MIKLLRCSAGLLFYFFSSRLKKVQTIGGRGELFNPFASRLFHAFRYLLFCYFILLVCRMWMLSKLFVLLFHLNIKLGCVGADVIFLEYLSENIVSEIEPDSCRALKPGNFLKM